MANVGEEHEEAPDGQATQLDTAPFTDVITQLHAALQEVFALKQERHVFPEV